LIAIGFSKVGAVITPTFPPESCGLALLHDRLGGRRSQSAALQDAWATAKKQGKIARQGQAEHEAQAIPRCHEKFSDQKIAARYTVAAASIGLPT
jgi:hypothetical protein